MTAVTRNCKECGSAFTAHREHARFCSARCRVAWNRRQPHPEPVTGNSLAGASLVDLIDELSERLTGMPPEDLRRLARDGTIVSWLQEGDRLRWVAVAPYDDAAAEE